MNINLSEVRIFVRPGFTDMRKQINGLAVIAEAVMNQQPFSGNLFLFCGRNRTILKVLYWDRNGFCLWMKRLESQTFQWPNEETSSLCISNRELVWLLDGLTIHQAKAHRSLQFTCIS